MGHELAGGLVVHLGEAGDDGVDAGELEGFHQSQGAVDVVEDAIGGVAGGEHGEVGVLKVELCNLLGKQDAVVVQPSVARALESDVAAGEHQSSVGQFGSLGIIVVGEVEIAVLVAAKLVGVADGVRGEMENLGRRIAQLSDGLLRTEVLGQLGDGVACRQRLGGSRCRGSSCPRTPASPLRFPYTEQ